MSPRISQIVLGVVCLGLCACAKEEVRTYKISKEKQKSTPAQEMPAADRPAAQGEMPAGHPPVGGEMPSGMPAGMPAGHPPVGGAAMTPGAAGGPVGAVEAAPGELTWTAPADWATKPLGQMRRGSYALKGSGTTDSDLSVIVLPGAAGGNLENVNRWRGQIGLPPIAQAALGDETTPLSTDSGLEVMLVDLKGPKNDSILGGIIIQQGQSWFFKLRGPTAQLQDQKPAFIAFIKTVKAR